MIKDLLFKHWRTTVLGLDFIVAAILLGCDVLTSGIALILAAVAGLVLVISKDAK